MGDLSAHFSRREFRCHHCGQIKGPDRELIAVLERLRSSGGDRPLPVVSGYRCAIHNKAVGGAPRSLHLLGMASDIPSGRFTVAQAREAGARGIGYCGPWVVHVDVRAGHLVTFSDC